MKRPFCFVLATFILVACGSSPPTVIGKGGLGGGDREFRLEVLHASTSFRDRDAVASPPSATPAVTADEVMEQFQSSSATDEPPEVFLASYTDNEVAEQHKDGTEVRVLVDRLVWIVIDRFVPAEAPPSVIEGPVVTVEFDTWAHVYDAVTGDNLLGFSSPASEVLADPSVLSAG